MDRHELLKLRKAIGYTQAAMAKAMYLSVRTYKDLENGDSPFQARHGLMAERVSLSEAIRARDPMLAVPSVRREALDLARLITEG